jgi:hypothetical protein
VGALDELAAEAVAGAIAEGGAFEQPPLDETVERWAQSRGANVGYGRHGYRRYVRAESSACPQHNTRPANG